MLRCDIITIFPEFFREAFDYGIIRRARVAGLVETTAHDLRKWTSDKHHIVDDRPFGGGEGMVLKPEPIFAAVGELTGCRNRAEYSPQTRVILLSPQGRVFTQELAADLSQNASQIVLICGRYEGVDERVVEHLATAEISIGDFVLSGGELGAALVVDTVARYVPGIVGKEESVLRDSFSDPASEERMVEYPHYTRPVEFRGWKVPQVLVSGDHEAVRRWREEASRQKTARNRPDLLV